MSMTSPRVLWSLSVLALVATILGVATQHAITAGKTVAAVPEQEAEELGRLAPAAGLVASASARILEDLVVTGKTPLKFGVIESATAGGSITITPHNQRVVSGAIKVSESMPFDRAKFSLRGIPNTDYSIYIPTSQTFTKQGAVAVPGVTALEAVDFKSYSETTLTETRRGRTNSTGEDTVYVGATLMVPQTVAPGSYSGEVLLSVAY